MLPVQCAAGIIERKQITQSEKGSSLRKEVLENHEKYLERIQLYKSFGYDVEKERSFILEKAQPLYGNMVEIGTGKGYFAMQLATQGYHFTSVDISEAEQNMARLNIEYFGLVDFVKFQIENAESLSFPDNSFDVIFCINTIHHLTNPFKAVDEMIRIVKSQGKIVLCDFTAQGFALLDKILATEGRKHEVSPVTLANIADYLQNKGFHMNQYQTDLQELVIGS